LTDHSLLSGLAGHERSSSLICKGKDMAKGVFVWAFFSFSLEKATKPKQTDGF
jgi:hypothetical protein